MTDRLAIVLPVYNEEASVGKVIEEWAQELNSLGVDYCFIAIDDGSKDQSLQILNDYAAALDGRMIVHHHDNRGHGQSCIVGYHLAVDKLFDYVLQIDSDGQCDVKYFSEFWESRSEAPVFGYRNSRDDGRIRWWISRIVSFVGLIGSGIWVKDANVPYRLMTKVQLQSVLNDIPEDFHLANILISLRLRQKFRIKWIQIHFRDRFGGSPSIKTFNFAHQGLLLLKQLWLS